MKNRAAVVILENKKVCLIKRIIGDDVYYVFPGGGIESKETAKSTAKREALEELGVEVKVNDCIAQVEFNGTQYFFLSKIMNGQFGTGNGDEYKDENRGRGTYLPVWVDVDILSSIDVRPKEVAIKVQVLFANQLNESLVQK